MRFEIRCHLNSCLIWNFRCKLTLTGVIRRKVFCCKLNILKACQNFSSKVQYMLSTLNMIRMEKFHSKSNTEHIIWYIGAKTFTKGNIVVIVYTMYQCHILDYVCLVNRFSHLIKLDFVLMKTVRQFWTRKKKYPERKHIFSNQILQGDADFESSRKFQFYRFSWKLVKWKPKE